MLPALQKTLPLCAAQESPQPAPQWGGEAQGDAAQQLTPDVSRGISFPRVTGSGVTECSGAEPEGCTLGH